jgi:hypothetical protein
MKKEERWSHDFFVRILAVATENMKKQIGLHEYPTEERVWIPGVTT